MSIRVPLILTLISIVVLAGCITPMPQQQSGTSNPNFHHTSNNGGGGDGGSNVHTNDQDNNSSEHFSENSTDNIVSLQPENVHSFVGQSFSLTIFCNPGMPIKAWELTIAFDPFYLQAIDVEYGTFFDDFIAFPSPNIHIDNEAGRIDNFFNLILGLGNTTTSGSFAIIQFENIYRGMTAIVINSIGLTNETRYIPVITSNCTINIL